MAKYFAVKFKNHSSLEDAVNYFVCDFPNHIHANVKESEFQNFYIQSDSSHIFEPQLNDWVEYYMHDCSYVGEMPPNIDRIRWTKQLGFRGMEDVIFPERQ